MRPLGLLKEANFGTAVIAMVHVHLAVSIHNEERRLALSTLPRGEIGSRRCEKKKNGRNHDWPRNAHHSEKNCDYRIDGCPSHELIECSCHHSKIPGTPMTAMGRKLPLRLWLEWVESLCPVVRA